MNGLYFITINWYNEYKEEDEISCAFVVAENFSEATRKVAADFEYINSINVEQIQSADMYDINCVYVPNDQNVIDAIKQANDY